MTVKKTRISFSSFDNELGSFFSSLVPESPTAELSEAYGGAVGLTVISSSVRASLSLGSLRLSLLAKLSLSEYNVRVFAGRNTTSKHTGGITPRAYRTQI
jgi:hypothetical protein